MTRSLTPWRPADEAEATATLTGFVEWLRATGRRPDATPRIVRGWAAQDRRAFHAATATFAGLAATTGLLDALPPGDRPALIARHADGRLGRWSRDALRQRADLPPTLLAAIAAADVPSLAASHLLGHETRPDDCLHWLGDPADPWPFGAWIVGACVLVGPADDETRELWPHARRYRVRPPSWAD
jgi:hypothetical protein